MTSAARSLGSPRPLVYPETDGEPIGETDVQADRSERLEAAEDEIRRLEAELAKAKKR
jgi:hypothetical protein